MDAPLIRLPRYARGLKLVRIGVFIMLLQLVLNVVMTLKALGADSVADVLDTFKWIQYFLWANLAAAIAMAIGSILALPDFQLAKLPIYRVLVAIVSFVLTVVALWWMHDVLTTFMDVVIDPESSDRAVRAAGARLERIQAVIILKDIAYVSGLIAVMRMVRQSAVANDKLYLRDAASDLTGLLVIMLVADAFYQLTYGVSQGASMFPIIGILASVVVTGFWIYCHFRLVRMLENAAYLVNEPHLVPTATVVSVGELPRSSARTSARTMPAPRASAPVVDPQRSSAPVLVVAPVVPAAPVPRAETSDPAEPPRFLT